MAMPDYTVLPVFLKRNVLNACARRQFYLRFRCVKHSYLLLYRPSEERQHVQDVDTVICMMWQNNEMLHLIQINLSGESCDLPVYSSVSIITQWFPNIICFSKNVYYPVFNHKSAK